MEGWNRRRTYKSGNSFNVPKEKKRTRDCSTSKNQNKSVPGARFLAIVRHTAKVVNRKPKVGFFGRFFSFFRSRKPTLRFFGCPKKRNQKTDSFFSVVFFPVPHVKNAYKSVWKSRYGWTHGQLRHTAAAGVAPQQQRRQRKGAVVGVGRLNTSTYYTAVSS